MIAGILASVAAGLYPTLLPSSPGGPHPGLDIYNAAAPENSLRIALWIYLFGMALVIIYLMNIYRVWRGKVTDVYHQSRAPRCSIHAACEITTFIASPPRSAFSASGICSSGLTREMNADGLMVPLSSSAIARANVSTPT